MIDSCYLGDARDGLRAFLAAGIRAQTCVTSPPYWGLRQYLFDGAVILRRDLDPSTRSKIELEIAKHGINPRA